MWNAVTNGPLTICCLTGLLFTQSACTYQKFRSPAWLALTLCAAHSAVCVQAPNRRCSKINLCICIPVYKFNIDELLLKLLAKRGSLTYFMYLPVQAGRACQSRLSVLALFTQNRTQRACTERSCLSRPNVF